MNHLLRGIAPITDAGWQLLDSEARERLTSALAARKLVDFSGAHGWDYSATNLGWTEALGDAPCEGVQARRRRVLQLVELRAEFALSREELRDAERGAADVDLEALDTAARRISRAENIAVFHGYREGGVTGITEASSHQPIELSADFDDYPGLAARLSLIHI